MSFIFILIFTTFPFVLFCFLGDFLVLIFPSCCYSWDVRVSHKLAQRSSRWLRFEKWESFQMKVAATYSNSFLFRVHRCLQTKQSCRNYWRNAYSPRSAGRCWPSSWKIKRFQFLFYPIYRFPSTRIFLCGNVYEWKRLIGISWVLICLSVHHSCVIEKHSAQC